jgi:pimeloyl-ACP methyl ester carboxylesterase
VIQLHSLGGGAWEDPLPDELLSRGWAVIESNFPWGAPEGLRPAGGRAELDEAAALLAGYVDQRLAEWAYGAEAVLEFLERNQPDLTTRPLAVVGFSLGALGAPTLAARLEDRLDALVLVGGGADLSAIMMRTTLDAMRLEAEPAAQAGFSDAYLDTTTLDPFHTAARVTAPTLQVHAAFDRIIPEATGDALHEQLGRPERWTVLIGHEGLFLSLPSLAGALADWIDVAVAPAPPSVPADPAQTSLWSSSSASRARW